LVLPGSIGNDAPRFFFVSPIAYVVLTGYVVLSGWFFFNLLVQFNRVISMYEMMRRPDIASRLNLNELVMLPLMYNMTIVLLLMVPLITMRLFSEEKKLRTDELLLTSPIAVNAIVLGKYLASLFFLLVLLGLTLIYPAILFHYGQPPPELGPIVAGYIGLFFLGAAFMAVGLFASSLTENQIVAGFLSMVVLYIFWLADSAGALFNSIGLHVNVDLVRFIRALSLRSHHATSFMVGVIRLEDTVFYVGLIAVMLFITAQLVASRRWRG